MDVPDVVRHGSKEVLFESYPCVGFNYRLTDLQAAVGRTQLQRLPQIIERRRNLADRYCVLLAEVGDIGLPEQPGWARSNWQSFCVRLPAAVSQRAVMQRMLDSGVATRRGVMCTHREAAYPPASWNCGNVSGELIEGSCKTLIESERAQDHCIVIPLFAQMTFVEQDRVVAALISALETTHARI
jgi:dTDP-4-amino-4,6-dideoxygalactose transaminase